MRIMTKHDGYSFVFQRLTTVAERDLSIFEDVQKKPFGCGEKYSRTQ